MSNESNIEDIIKENLDLLQKKADILVTDKAATNIYVILLLFFI